MRTSMKRTPAAVLRAMLGMKDSEMAELLGCSRATIHSLESGRLKMSDGMAKRIFHETEISPDWLLAGDQEAPPVTVTGEPFSKATFERARAAKDSRNSRSEVLLWLDVLDFASRLAATLVSANNRREYFMVKYKTWKALQALSSEFGQDLSVYESGFTPLSTNGEFLEKDPEQAGVVLSKMVEAYAELEEAFAPLFRAKPVKEEKPSFGKAQGHLSRRDKG